MYVYISATAQGDQASKSLAGRRRTSVDGSNRQLEGGPFVVAVPRKTRAAPPVTSVSQRRYLPRSFTYVSSHYTAAGAGGARAHTRLSHRLTAPSVAPRAEERGGWERGKTTDACDAARGARLQRAVGRGAVRRRARERRAEGGEVFVGDLCIYTYIYIYVYVYI